MADTAHQLFFAVPQRSGCPNVLGRTRSFCDFIAYLFAPSKVGFVMPVVPLQRAWRMHGRKWLQLYGTRRARNPGYTSVSDPVPRAVLIQAIAEAMLLT